MVYCSGAKRARHEYSIQIGECREIEMADLGGRTALITGATAGFGAAIAKRLAGMGAKIVATGRREERLNALRKDLGDSVLPLVLDVRDRDGVEEKIENLPSEFSDIDILVNNAGLALGLEGAQDANLDDWEQMIDTNIKGLTYMTRAVLPGMVARGRGHVVNIGSVAASYPYPGGNVYGGTKAFVNQFSLNMRADLLGTPVRVTCIEPGLSETEFSEVRFKGDKEKASAIYAGAQPMSGDTIADVVAYVTTLPDHVNVNVIELMPVCQAFSPFTIHRTAQ